MNKIEFDIETGFISFPTVWTKSDEDAEEKAELLGIKYVAPTRPGVVDINPDLIASKNDSDKPNESTIRTSDGNCWAINASLQDINDVLKKFNSLKRARK